MRTQVRVTSSSICAATRTAVVTSGNFVKNKTTNFLRNHQTYFLLSKSERSVNTENSAVFVAEPREKHGWTPVHARGMRAEDACKVAARHAVKASKCVEFIQLAYATKRGCCM